MTNSVRMRKRREHLWNIDPRCFWCCKVTTLGAPSRRADAATIDHLYPRGDHRRSSGRSELVLACVGCNKDKGGASPSTWRATIAKRYYIACGPVADPSDPFTAASYLGSIGQYERESFLEWAHRASSSPASREVFAGVS